VGAFVPDDLTRAHDGRLWVRFACLDGDGAPAAGLLSLARFSLSQDTKIVVPLERVLVEKDALLEQQALRVRQLEQLFAETAASVQQQLLRASTLEQLLAEKDLRASQLEQLLAEKDAVLEQHVLRASQLEQQVSERKTRLAELERTLQITYESRSWKMTAPLRKMMTWLRR
jgi:chromosome segregation ATPase